MAEALEASSVVIMVVSKDYKESANCRMEAKYANQLFKKGRVKIVFVMTQHEYTTTSQPECCDGWIGITIGDSLWYPLWSESQVDSTAKDISKVIGSLGMRNGRNISSPTPAPPAQPIEISTPASVNSNSNSGSGGIDHAGAFAILKDPNSSLDHGALEKMLSDLGVSSSADLLELDAGDYNTLAEMLKKVPKKKFMASLHL
jgi:hypothetical protein